ncbi:unnamed protein product [Euphydryas editha]|uniref:Uncharacterized protein n=1 Tax=Euphydryas editha TaxID=104508 RepID=A0AAU9UVC5_EUPED|nr:unnamed protein product [Euphydryas editha]
MLGFDHAARYGIEVKPVGLSRNLQIVKQKSSSSPSSSYQSLSTAERRPPPSTSKATDSKHPPSNGFRRLSSSHLFISWMADRCCACRFVVSTREPFCSIGRQFYELCALPTATSACKSVGLCWQPSFLCGSHADSPVDLSLEVESTKLDLLS